MDLPNWGEKERAGCCHKRAKASSVTRGSQQILYKLIYRKANRAGNDCSSGTVLRNGKRLFPCYKLPDSIVLSGASLVAQTVKNLPAVHETQVRSLHQEGSLEEEMATHSRILAWRIPWTEEPGRLQSMRLQRVRHD